MPAREEQYQQQFDKDRARQAEWSEQDKDRQNESAQGSSAADSSVSLPWSMLCLAILFDIIGIMLMAKSGSTGQTAPFQAADSTKHSRAIERNVGTLPLFLCHFEGAPATEKS